MSEEATAPVVAPPPGHPRFPLVDSLRAIAALTVLVHHTGYDTSAVQNPHYGTLIERTNIGVTLFFLISGFLLYRPFVAARMLGAPRTRLRDFARRRLLRIVPAYWLALTVLAIYPGESGVFTNHWWIYYGFLQIYNDGTVLRGLGQAWSLCVELTFYMVLPFYAALMARCLRRVSMRWQVRIELGLLALISLGSWGYRFYLRTDQAVQPVGQHAAGVRRLVRRRNGAGDHQRGPAIQGSAPAALRIIRRWPVLPWAAAVLAYVVAAEIVSGPHIIQLFGQTSLYFSPREDLALHILFAVVSAGLLIPAVVGADGGGVVRRILADRRLAWLGLISYGIYLWQGSVLQVICQPQGYGFVNDSCRMHDIGLLQHVPFLSLTVISIPIVIACAAASYYVVERPLLRLKYRRTPPAAPPPPSRPAPRAVATAER